MYNQQKSRLIDLCIRYIPCKGLGDFLPAKITNEMVANFTNCFSKLNDDEVYKHLRHLGISEKRTRDFIEERNEILSLDYKLSL